MDRLYEKVAQYRSASSFSLILLPGTQQSWMETILKAQGQYSVGFNATPLATACQPVPPRPGG